jgi:hypothetical protein
MVEDKSMKSPFPYQLHPFIQPSLLRENPTSLRLYLLFTYLTRFQNDCLGGQARCCHRVWCFLPLQPSTPPIVNQLTVYGHDARATSLPSVGRRTGLPRATPAGDAGYMQSVTSKLVEEGKDVVLMMHSYGGVARRQSGQGLAKADCQAAGKTRGASGLVYPASPILPASKVDADACGGHQA